MKKKILLIAGTGVIGSHLKQILTQQKYDVYITTRKNYSNKKSIQHIIGDSKNTTFIKKTITDLQPDVIVDFLVYKSLDFKKIVNFFLDHCQHYVYLSSCRIYENNGLRKSKENTKKITTSIFLEKKL